jgi:hypothetical protein
MPVYKGKDGDNAPGKLPKGADRSRGLWCYGAETVGNNIYVRRETLRLLLVFCTGPFWYTQQLYFDSRLRLYISHGTDTIMTQYDYRWIDKR